MAGIVVLSGGVGGGRFARALAETVDPATITVVGNVGDDLEVLGLHVSPDLDSVLYALAGLNDEERGWGRADETWNALATRSTACASRAPRRLVPLRACWRRSRRRSCCSSRPATPSSASRRSSPCRR